MQQYSPPASTENGMRGIIVEQVTHGDCTARQSNHQYRCHHHKVNMVLNVHKNHKAYDRDGVITITH